MSSTFENYFRLNRLLLIFTGLWPYRNSKWIYMQQGIFLLMFLSGVIVQLTIFVTTEYSFQLALKIIAYILLPVTYFIKYCAFSTVQESFRQLLDHVQADWKLFSRAGERAIIQKYANMSRTLTVIFASCTWPSYTVFAALNFIPQILNIVAPLNESRPNQPALLVEYFVDQQKYFYPIVMHINIFVLLGVLTVIATETVFMSFVLHFCGMLTVCGYQITNAFDGNSMTARDEERESTVRAKVIEAIVTHKRTLEFQNLLWSAFMKHYNILLGIGVVSLSLNIFRSSLAYLATNEHAEQVITTFTVVSHFAYLLYFNFNGQIALDHSHDMFTSICNSKWYTASASVQKIVLFFMRNSMGTTNINMAGGIFVPCLEGFTTIVNMSMSYVMLFHSTV